MKTNMDLGLLIMRLALGVIFIMHGLQKIGVIGGGSMEGTVQMFQENWNIPAFATYLVTAAELLGGIGVLVGFLGRIASAAIALVMIGAFFMVHIKNGFFVSDGGVEMVLGFGAMALGLMFMGMGRYSIDGMMAEKKSATG